LLALKWQTVRRNNFLHALKVLWKGFMSHSPLTIYCNIKFDEPVAELLRRETAPHRLILDDQDSPNWDEVDVAFGQPPVEAVLRAPRLKWVHVSSAGYTRYDNDEVRDALQQREAQLTNSSHVYDEPCAQHLLAMMLAFARQLLPCYAAQIHNRDWESARRRLDSFLLNDQTVLLLGFGAIAQRLTQLLQPFGAHIIAVRRHVQTFEGVEVVGEDALPEVLGQADHVVNILPDNAATHHFMNAARFGAMKPGSYFYNIGRGSTVDQEALREALDSEQLRGAYLDVTDPEPLPPTHPLWTTPHCFITPHSGGGHRGEGERLARHFLQNLQRFAENEELQDRVF
jgi:phosphoglycerate dehydrogenase-like enzyme